MTTPVETNPHEPSFTPEDELGPLDWLVAPDDAAGEASQQINDRRARQESPETLRLVRAL